MHQFAGIEKKSRTSKAFVFTAADTVALFVVVI